MASNPASSAASTSTEPGLSFVQSNGISMASFEWRPELRGQAPTLLFVHATGFHARVWDQVIARFPDRHVIAVEQRGHGRSEAKDFSTWEEFSRDLAGFAAALDLRGVVAIGHSMGAHALVQAAAFAPDSFSQLVLIDPVMSAPADYHLPAPPSGTVHPSAYRKNQFESAQSMFDRFVDRPPYSVFERQCLLDYCVHGLRPADSGEGYQLTCAPSFEGQIYPLARQNRGIYASIRSLHIPVLVVRAREQDASILPWDPLGSPTWPGLAAEFPQGRGLQTDKTHMMPMEDPAMVAQLIQDAMAGR